MNKLKKAVTEVEWSLFIDAVDQNMIRSEVSDTIVQENERVITSQPYINQSPSRKIN